MKPNHFTTCLLAMTALAAGLTAQRALVVAPIAEEGVDFTDIQSAVIAAVDGDTVLVRNGSYRSFIVSGKGVSVVADGPAVTCTGIAVELTSAAQSVVIRGFSGNSCPLLIDRCAGSVAVERCVLFGTWGQAVDIAPIGILQSSHVTLIDCRAAGGSPFFVPPPIGLRAVDSVVQLYSCHISGGDGVSSPLATPGADAAVLTNTVLYASDSTLVGGSGARASEWQGTCLRPATSGGHCVRLSGGGFTALGCELRPGAAGDHGTACQPALPGRVSAGPGYFLQLPGPALALSAGSPVRMLGTASGTVTGPGGYSLILAISGVSQPTSLPGCRGVLQSPLSSSLVVPLGRTSSGVLNFNLPVPDLGLLTTNLHLQVIGATLLECQLGGATSLTLLHFNY